MLLLERGVELLNVAESHLSLAGHLPLNKRDLVHCVGAGLGEGSEARLTADLMSLYSRNDWRCFVGHNYK